MKRLRDLRDERGAALPITGFFIVVGIALLALGIDLGHLFMVKSELQRTADAAALAGALRLTTPAGAVKVAPATPDCARAVTAAQSLGTTNPTDAAPLPLDNLTIRLGIYDNKNNPPFTETGCADPKVVNAVQATASKAVDLYVGSIITGSPTVTLAAQATALTGAVGKAKTFPLAVDDDKLPQPGQPLIIHLNPTPGDDGCWHTFFEQNPASSLLRDMIDGKVDTPELKVGDYIKVKEGVDDATLKTLGDALKTNGNPSWDIVLPVIPADSHTGWAEVLGFAAVRLNLVDSSGKDKRIEMETIGYSNNYVAPGTLPGGTNYYGLSAGSPRLVQ